ncbi:hypothetical protein N9L68_01570 [bacterium]|nr:hypothetical protein [bacterium]
MAELNRVITPGNMQVGQLDNASTSSASTRATPRPTNVADMKGPKCQSHALGFLRGAYVERKKVEALTDSNVFVITSMETGVAARLDEITHNDYHQVLFIEFDELMDNWKLKAENSVPQNMPMYSFDLCNPFEHASWELAAAKGACHVALRVVYEKHQAAAQSLDMYKNPILMRATVDIAAGQLKLVAAGTEITNKESNTGVGLGQFQISKEMQNLYLIQKVSLPLDKAGNVNESPFVAPLWHIVAVEEKKDANMKVVWEVVDIGGYQVKVPMATNAKKVQKGQVLTRLKVKGCLKPPGTSEGKGVKRQRLE